jgi:hypothetical protein
MLNGTVFFAGKGMNKIFKIIMGAGIVGLVSLNELANTAIATPLRYQAQLVAQKISQALYGLGLPKTAGTGGSVRLRDETGGGFESSGTRTIPILALMVPEDGARTASLRPTVYWNMVLNEPQDYKLSFFLQETAAEDSKVVLEQEITITKGGLFKFQIPQTLEGTAPRRWGVRCKWADGRIVTANGLLAFSEPKPEIKMALSAAKTDLEKARVYADSGYWYDAIDSYTNWINGNPQDSMAIQERGNIIREGFKGRQGVDTKSFVSQINSAPVKEFK